MTVRGRRFPLGGLLLVTVPVICRPTFQDPGGRRSALHALGDAPELSRHPPRGPHSCLCNPAIDAEGAGRTGHTQADQRGPRPMSGTPTTAKRTALANACLPRQNLARDLERRWGAPARTELRGGLLPGDREKTMPEPQHSANSRVAVGEGGLLRELGLTDTTMIVAGTMIGSGIFIVSADMARHLGASGWLMLAWLVTGLLTLAGALSYGELAAMMPRAGGQYVFLRDSYSPLWGFLFGWTHFLVIKTGSIAAVAAAFAKYLGVLVPSVSASAWVIRPIPLSHSYAVSLSTQQLVAIVVIVLLTAVNMRGVRAGKLVQNGFTFAKTLGLLALVVLGVVFAVRGVQHVSNFSAAWTPRNELTIRPDLGFLPSVAAGNGWYGLLVAFCLAQVGSLFAADAWADVTFVAGETRNPRRSIPLAMLFGTLLVTALYLLANLAYLVLLPFERIQQAPDDRVASAALAEVSGGAGAVIMALAIMISTFGCNNGMILTGARVYFAMARDGLFFRATGRVNVHHVPAMGLALQGVWAVILLLPRTRLRDAAGAPLIDPVTGSEQFGNLYSALLDYVMFAQLLFYVLTVAALFVLRRTRPDAHRPYRAWGYPIVPAAYVVVASVIMLALLFYKTQTTWPGLLIVLTGIPAYFCWKMTAGKPSHSPPAG